jgi:hypothetical protein
VRQLREVKRLHHHTLTGEGRVAVDDNRQHAHPALVMPAFLARAHRSLHHRPDNLEMRWIERQRQMHRPPGGIDVRREALVVLHVAGAGGATRLAFELQKQLRRRLAENVDENVQSPTVCHTDNDFLHARVAGTLDQFIEHRNQALATLQREALLTNVLGMKIMFQALGSGQTLE